MPQTASPPRPTAAPDVRPDSLEDAAVRIVYQAFRALVLEAGVVTLSELTAVTRLDPGSAAAAANRLVRCGPLAVSRQAGAAGPAWYVRRTDR